MKSISRQNARDMIAIAREQLGSRADTTLVQVCYDDDGEYWHCSAHWSEPTDEGWSSFSVSVVVLDVEARQYDVDTCDAGRDCDGSVRRTHRFTLAPRKGKRKRWYPSFRWDPKLGRNRREGRFGVRSAFYVVGDEESSQRDYSAEAAGY